MLRGGRTVGLVYDEKMCAHENLYNKSHPEKPERIRSIFDMLKSEGIVDRCVRVEARDATTDELDSVHDKEHTTIVYTLSEAKNRPQPHDDTYINEGSYSSALLAAGSVVELSLHVARGDLSAGAAVVRPPGHHAKPHEAMGFCLFNNVAIAAKVLVNRNNPPAERVLIVDWDVHHGNGTQHIFWKDPNVLSFSIHRKDLYPDDDGNYEDGNYDKVGEGDGVGFNINVPWPKGGFGDRDYLSVFDNLLLPAAYQFKPDIVLVSAGFDSAAGDDMGGCKVTTAGYSQMTHKLMDLADGRLVLVLEGGYDLDSLSTSYLACMKVILGDPPEELVDAEPIKAETLDLVRKIVRVGVLRQKWPALSKAEPGSNSRSTSNPSGASEVICLSDDENTGGAKEEVIILPDEDESADLVQESGDVN